MSDVAQLVQYGFVASHVLLATIASGHALLYKKDQRSAFGWVGVCILFPIAGPLLYYTFGINRVRARAHLLAKKKFFQISVPFERGDRPTPPPGSSGHPRSVLSPAQAAFADVSDAVSSFALASGNAILPLENGDVAYGAMLDAIDAASESVLLMTYIMHMDRIGHRFVAALTSAVKRGVKVHVMIDGIGDYYSVTRASNVLRGAGIDVARFLPPRLVPPSLLVNLRNHRKLLVVDGATAFTGGMNISADHCRHQDRPARVTDLHFRLDGPVAVDLARQFCDTWLFATRREINVNAAPVPGGNAVCRVLIDGPDENMDKLEMNLIGAISLARHSIDIMTPYFLPTGEMISALKTARLRGVAINIILPARSNLRYVDWATRNMLWELLQWQVSVFYQPPPFAHTKLFTVDGIYSIVGSANIDPRSLRLNFELCVEVFDRSLAMWLKSLCDRTIVQSRQVSLVEVDERSFPVRLRDALCWLFSPYL